MPDGDLLAWTQLTVTVPWLSVYFYVLIVVAVAIIGGSAIALILYLARNGMLIAAGAGAGAGASGGAILLAKKRKPRVRVADKSAGLADDSRYDLTVKVNLANGIEGRLESGELKATFEFEIFNRSGRKQEVVLAYYLVDMGGVRMPESAMHVKIDKHRTDTRSAIVELPSPGAYALHVEARTLKGGLLGSDHVNVRSSWSESDCHVGFIRIADPLSTCVEQDPVAPTLSQVLFRTAQYAEFDVYSALYEPGRRREQVKLCVVHFNSTL